MVDGRAADTLAAARCPTSAGRRSTTDPAVELGHRLHRQEFTRELRGHRGRGRPVLRHPWTRLEPRESAALAARPHAVREGIRVPVDGCVPDRAYNTTNPEPCTGTAPGSPCYTPNSHVPERRVPRRGRRRPARPHQLARGGLPPGPDPDLRPLLVARRRAPTTAERNCTRAGRGLRGGEARVRRPHGGCSTLNRWRAMAPKAEPTGGDANCGIARHFERFELDGNQIAEHRDLYYGYVRANGGLDARVEFPARHNPLGGPGTSWTAFNVLRSGTWSAQVFTDPGEHAADRAARLVRVEHGRPRGRERRPARQPGRPGQPLNAPGRGNWTVLLRFGTARRPRLSAARSRSGAGAAAVSVDADPPHVRGRPLRRLRRPEAARNLLVVDAGGEAELREPGTGRIR